MELCKLSRESRVCIPKAAVSIMISKIIILVFHIFIISSQSLPSKAEADWLRIGYYSYKYDNFPISNINSSLFTHLICGFADLNFTSYQLSFSHLDGNSFSTFTPTVKQKNPSVTTLLSIAGDHYQTLSSMLSNSSYRKAFIDSSIYTARHYGFQGLDFWWYSDSEDLTSSDLHSLVILFKEWREAIRLEATNSTHQRLILIAVVEYSPDFYSESYPIESIQQYLDWIHVKYILNYTLMTTNITSVTKPLYNPASDVNMDHGITAWIHAGLPPNKLVMGLFYCGDAWTLVNSKENGIGAPAKEPGTPSYCSLTYKGIKNTYINSGGNVTYNSTYVVNYVTAGTTWISFDDVEATRAKVSYAKDKKLLGYFVWSITYDYNWVLSEAAAHFEEGTKSNSAVQEDITKSKKRPWAFRLFTVIILPTIAAVILLLLGLFIYLRWIRKFKSKGSVDKFQESRSQVNNYEAIGDFNGNAPSLVHYSIDDIQAATDGFSFENKLGEGGYGPVYKGVLADGQEIAVKKLSKTSIQGFQEFKNEVILTAKLQHLNLVRLLGFCIGNEGHMLIYEYMLNKSLDYHLFDPVKKYILDWEKRVHIIDGVCQGLLYLQEYSRFTIIHRDLKASNILLDENMKPKISDFGMARISTKEGMEAHTERIVGTLGYAPPEYLKRGIYSTKSDVYSFGVLLLQIISGKRVSILYGGNEHLSLLQYAYEVWNNGKGMKFMDPSLDDGYSPCKLMRCLHIALLCVQENSIDRPSMLEVSWMLKNEGTELTIPKKPGFSNQTDEDVQCDSTTSNLALVRLGS